MKKIYLMRHGETLFNLMDINQGQCDSPLTEKELLSQKQRRTGFRIMASISEKCIVLRY